VLVINVTAEQPLDRHVQQAWESDAVVNMTLPDGQHMYLVPESRMQSLLETWEILQDPGAVTEIAEGMRDAKNNDVVPLGEVARMVAEREE
jgi:PHD/YefM family antitoxin component YafN of YafNO toxin-antitoxin module